MFLNGLDETDQRIIELLIDNGRMSYSDIGEAVGLSRVAVSARIAALTKRGIIEGYTTIINPQKVSGAISCYFEIETEPVHLDTVIEILKACETVTQVYRVSGLSKLHAHAVAAGQEELEAFLSEVVDSLPGIRSLSTNIILSRFKDIKGLRL